MSRYAHGDSCCYWPCPACASKVDTHIALTNLMSCFEIVGALYLAGWLAFVGEWASNVVGEVAPGSQPKWVV